MISQEEYNHFTNIAHEGNQHSDPNISGYAETALRGLQRYDDLKQHSAKQKLEDEIRKAVKTIILNRTSYK